MLKGHLNFHTIKEDQFKNDMFLLEHYPSVSHHFLIAAAIADLYSNPLIGHSQAYEGDTPGTSDILTYCLGLCDRTRANVMGTRW